MNPCARQSGRVVLAGIVLLIALTAGAGDGTLRTISVNGAELHYRVQGNGPAVVFVHGGLADYREWLPVMEPLKGRYTTIAYSRRHSFPNRENPTRPDHSPKTEAEDLAALIDGLGVSPTHVVGVSYGASTAIFLALSRPELVASLVLVEPPLVSWLPQIEGGQTVLDDFNGRLVTPVRAAFKSGDRDLAFAATLDYFVGADAKAHVPAEVLSALRGNLRDWEVMFRSSELLPDIPRESLRELKLPVLMLSGADSYELGRLVDAELERTLPVVTRFVVADGTHDACAEHPAVCAREIGRFLADLEH
ncbi:MAG: alpha/beta hydrolase [Steroidobacteraceae bacterium]